MHEAVIERRVFQTLKRHGEKVDDTTGMPKLIDEVDHVAASRRYNILGSSKNSGFENIIWKVKSMNNSWSQAFRKNSAEDKSTSIFRRFCFNEKGATAIEYAFIAALVAATIIAAITMLGTDVTKVFGNISNAIGNAPPDMTEGSGEQPGGGSGEDKQTLSDRGEVTRPGGDRGNRVPR